MFNAIFDFALLAALYAIIYRTRLRRREGRYRIWFTLFYIYLCMVICVTLMPFQLAIPGANPLFLSEVNLEPFRDIKRGYLGARTGAALNFLMFVPLGFLLPTLKKRGIIKVTFLSFLTSLSIESIQLLYCWGAVSNRRTFDVTDLIMNTAGGLAGYVFFRLARPLLVRLDEGIPR